MIKHQAAVTRRESCSPRARGSTSAGAITPSCSLRIMDLVRGLTSLPLAGTRSAVTIGFFDGVHRGHRAVIGRMVDVARSRALTPVGVTFDRHPREILTPGKEPLLLTTLERKADLIAEMGV